MKLRFLHLQSAEKNFIIVANNTVMITRTDARVIGSLEAALNYAEALILAFAGKIFGEAPTSLLGLSS